MTAMTSMPALIKNETSLFATPGERSFRVERWFDAPRHLVWKAVTAPELVPRWWGPECAPIIDCQIDLRGGGAWRYLVKNDGGNVEFYGEFREVLAPERLVKTSIFSLFPQAVAVETMTLVADGARTKLIVEVVHGSVEARDGHLSSGMETGMRASHAKLEALVRDLMRT